MKFTFGIITDGLNTDRVNQIIKSIRDENIKEYQIVIVGPTFDHVGEDITNIFFVDQFAGSAQPAWITKKKNLITENAKYDNIVYMHDYYALERGWYLGQLAKGEDFSVRMDKIVNIDGSRFRDWCIWPHNGNWMDNEIGRECLIPYNISHLSKFMYISGGYWVAKKHVMKEFPLNENLLWGQGEDVLWSKQVREKYKFSMNPFSIVNIIKPGKDKVFDEISNERLKKILSLA